MLEIISIHIPKTAGRSFLAILNEIYEPDSVAHFDRKNFSVEGSSAVEQFKSRINNNIRVIHGHFQFNEIKDLKNDHVKVITWLRDPVERVISNYSFFKKRISISENNEELRHRINESLMEYASMENSRNRMSKFTEGLDLNEFFFVGITEYFQEDITLLANKLNTKLRQIPRINDNAEFKLTLPAVTKEQRNQIAELNLKDMELYERALEIHHKKTI